MIPLQKIRNIFRFIHHIDEIYWVSNFDYSFNVFNIITRENKKLLEFDISYFFDIVQLEEYIYLSFPEKLIVYSISNKRQITEFTTDHFLPYFITKNGLVGSMRDKNCFEITKDGIEKLNIKLKKLDRIRFINANVYILQNIHSISCFNYEGKLIWERDLKEVGRFYEKYFYKRWEDGSIKDVQIFEDKLIVSLYGHKILALSIATGETIWEQTLDCEVAYIALDKSEGIIYTLCIMKYKLDASTGEILFSKPESMWQGQPIDGGFATPTLTKDGIYAATQISKPAKIVKYSKETFDVLHVIELDNEALIPTNHSPIITDKYLMMLDGEYSLQIFELKDFN